MDCRRLPKYTGNTPTETGMAPEYIVHCMNATTDRRGRNKCRIIGSKFQTSLEETGRVLKWRDRFYVFTRGCHGQGPYRHDAGRFFRLAAPVPGSRAGSGVRKGRRSGSVDPETLRVYRAPWSGWMPGSAVVRVGSRRRRSSRWGGWMRWQQRPGGSGYRILAGIRRTSRGRGRGQAGGGPGKTQIGPWSTPWRRTCCGECGARN